MRELAFRVYDKTEGKYRNLDGLHDTFLIDKNGRIGYYNLQNGSGGDECIIEQFTGVKASRTGQKVFEGDIVNVYVQSEWSHTRVMYVMFSDDMHKGSFVTVDPKYSDACFGHRHLNDRDNTILEVIGNIHDNPELLEEQK